MDHETISTLRETDDAGASRWCAQCCTDHLRQARCPGDLRATGDEEEGWRVTVHTPRGFQAYGVLLAPAGDLWRARILTYPKVLWLVPGGSGTLKFAAKTAQDAERKARDFIRAHCASRGYLMRDELAPVEKGSGLARAGLGNQLPRFRRALPVRFGKDRPTIVGTTHDLSECGLFVVTERPYARGTATGLVLQLEHCTVPLRGTVAWARRVPSGGRPTGMGLNLVSPPQVYVRYVQALA